MIDVIRCSRLISINSSLPGQNVRHFADDILKDIFVNEKLRVVNRISLKFVPKGPIDYKSSIIQVMAWSRPGDNKPFPEAILTQSLDAYMRR